MEIGIFNQTEENLDKELKELKELIDKIIIDEKLENIYFNVIIVDNKEIRNINREYRNIDRETDVISFALEDDKTMPSIDGIRILGDIYISVDKVKEQAKEYEHSFKRELSFLTVHGLLHLLGYDHMKEEDEKVMFGKQKEILDRYGIIK